MASTTIQRIWGSDRYDTAIEICKNGWIDDSEYAVLASGENFPDALSAAPLAKKYNAPILLNSGATLDSRVEDELKSLGVKQIFIVGGSSVVPDTIKDKLQELGIGTTRLWGQNRYETSVRIAEQLDFNGQVAVANGEEFADALSIAPIAAEKSMPVILTPPGTLPDVTAEYIKNNKITKTYIIGENDVVSDDITNSFPNCERIWGSSKYDTNIAVLNKFKDDLDFNNICLANGENFPDALAGSALAAKNSSAIVLVNDNIGQTTQKFIFDKSPSLNNIKVLGGNGVINNNLVNKIVYPNINEIVNLPKDAIAIREGEWIYYSARLDGRTPLSKCNIDGTSAMQLTDKHASQITVVGDWIYFISLYDDSSTYLYRIKTDGTCETKLSDDQCTWFKTSDNKIYSTSIIATTGNYSFTTMDMDGSNKVNIPVDGMIIQPALVDNYFYYIEQSTTDPIYIESPPLKIYKMKTDGSDKIQISSEEPNTITELKVYDNWLYFITASNNGQNQYHLKKMKLDGTEKTNIVDVDAYAFDISEDWIYYFDPDCRLSKIKIDGSENTKISDIKGHQITDIKDGWIYYNVVVDEYWIPHKIRIDGTDNIDIHPWI